MPINLPSQNDQPAGGEQKETSTAQTALIKTEPKNNKLDKINLWLEKFSSIPISEKLFFVQYLGIMLKAGISLSVALQT